MTTIDPVSQALRMQLTNRSWYKESPIEVRETLVKLDASWNGLIRGLLERPEQQDEFELVSLNYFGIPPKEAYGATLQWCIKRPDGETYLRQMFAWRRGNPAGGKGVVLVQNEKGIDFSHIIVLRGLSIPVGDITYDCPGGGLDEGETPEQCFCRECTEETGIRDFIRIINLGTFYPDQSLTPMEGHLFAGVISHQVFEEQLDFGRTEGFGDLDRNNRIQVVEVKDLWGEKGFVAKNPDGYFRACFAVLVGRGILCQPAHIT